MARISWFSAGEASSGPKFKGTCEIAESRNVHPSIWLVSAMVTDMWHMIIEVSRLMPVATQAKTAFLHGPMVWKVADRRNRTRNLLCWKRYTNHLQGSEVVPHYTSLCYTTTNHGRRTHGYTNTCPLLLAWVSHFATAMATVHLPITHHNHYFFNETHDLTVYGHDAGFFWPHVCLVMIRWMKNSVVV